MILGNSLDCMVIVQYPDLQLTQLKALPKIPKIPKIPEAREANEASQVLLEGPRCPQDAFKTAPGAPKMVQYAPKTT